MKSRSLTAAEGNRLLNKWQASTSEIYKLRQFIIAAVLWVLFNMVSGFLTGDQSLADNYFILVVCLFIAWNRCSYKVFYNSGNIVTRQFGMVTQNISLYQASEVFEKNGDLHIHYPDDSRYTIKLHALNAAAQLDAKETIVPLVGEPPLLTEETDPKAMTMAKKPDYVECIITGIVLLGLGLVSLKNGVVYLPGKGGFIELSKDPIAFYTFQVICLAVGAFSLWYGANGLFRKPKV